MTGEQLKAHVAIVFSRTCGGLNNNALKYLIPVWINPFTCATYRLMFGAIAFWIIGWIRKDSEDITWKDKLQMLSLGIVGVFGNMIFFAWGIKYTTPTSGSIIAGLIPIWVYLILLLRKTETIQRWKVIGLFLGIGGVCIHTFTHKEHSLASNPLLGDFLVFCSTFMYAIYIIGCGNLVKRVGLITLSKWGFLGAAIVSCICSIFLGFDAPMFNGGFHWLPLAVFTFDLIFPTVLAYLLQLYSQRFINATTISVYGNVAIIVAAIVALIFHQDVFHWTLPIAIFCICFGIYLVEKGESLDAKKRTT